MSSLLRSMFHKPLARQATIEEEQQAMYRIYSGNYGPQVMCEMYDEKENPCVLFLSEDRNDSDAMTTIVLERDHMDAVQRILDALTTLLPAITELSRQLYSDEEDELMTHPIAHRVWEWICKKAETNVNTWHFIGCIPERLPNSLFHSRGVGQQLCLQNMRIGLADSRFDDLIRLWTGPCRMLFRNVRVVPSDHEARPLGEDEDDLQTDYETENDEDNCGFETIARHRTMHKDGMWLIDEWRTHKHDWSRHSAVDAVEPFYQQEPRFCFPEKQQIEEQKQQPSKSKQLGHAHHDIVMMSHAMPNVHTIDMSFQVITQGQCVQDWSCLFPLSQCYDLKLCGKAIPRCVMASLIPLVQTNLIRLTLEHISNYDVPWLTNALRSMPQLQVLKLFKLFNLSQDNFHAFSPLIQVIQALHLRVWRLRVHKQSVPLSHDTMTAIWNMAIACPSARTVYFPFPQQMFSTSKDATAHWHSGAKRMCSSGRCFAIAVAAVINEHIRSMAADMRPICISNLPTSVIGELRSSICADELPYPWDSAVQHIKVTARKQLILVKPFLVMGSNTVVRYDAIGKTVHEHTWILFALFVLGVVQLQGHPLQLFFRDWIWTLHQMVGTRPFWILPTEDKNGGETGRSIFMDMAQDYIDKHLTQAHAQLVMRSSLDSCYVMDYLGHSTINSFALGQHAR